MIIDATITGIEYRYYPGNTGGYTPAGWDYSTPFRNYEYAPKPAAVGWICPKCGAGMAPWASRCGCRGHYGFQWWSQWDTTHTVSSTIETTNDICTDMLWAAADSFRGVWDNDADAVYDDMGND